MYLIFCNNYPRNHSLGMLLLVFILPFLKGALRQQAEEGFVAAFFVCKKSSGAITSHLL